MANPNHPLAKKLSVVLRDLSHYQLVFPKQDYLDYVSHFLALENFKIELTENLILSSSFLVKRMLKEKMILSFLPLDVVEEELDSNELVHIPLECPALSLTVYATYRTSSFHQELIDSFISFLLANCQRWAAGS